MGVGGGVFLTVFESKIFDQSGGKLELNCSGIRGIKPSQYTPAIISDDADGLICICRPRDWPLSEHLTQRVTVSAGVRQVREVFEHSGLIGKVRRLGELRLSF